MKKITVILSFVVLFFTAPFVAKAGGVYDGPSVGTHIIGARLGLSNIVGANVTYDYALAKVWKGTFTIGGQVGYMWDGANATVAGIRVSASYNFIDIKVRTTYRFNVVVPEWEVYGGVALGGGAGLYRERINGVGIDASNASGGYFSGAFILGSTYHFTDMIGINLEFDLGNWEAAWVNIGVQIKL